MQEVEPRGRREVLRGRVFRTDEPQFSLRTNGQRLDTAVDGRQRLLIDVDRTVASDKHARTLLAGTRLMVVVRIGRLFPVLMAMFIVNARLADRVPCMCMMPAAPGNRVP
ncbi:MAG: hypothetical protein AB7L90_26495 [Hyphomicrobiaceae bacterium]